MTQMPPRWSTLTASVKSAYVCRYCSAPVSSTMTYCDADCERAYKAFQAELIMARAQQATRTTLVEHGLHGRALDEAIQAYEEAHMRIPYDTATDDAPLAHMVKAAARRATVG